MAGRGREWVEEDKKNTQAQRNRRGGERAQKNDGSFNTLYANVGHLTLSRQTTDNHLTTGRQQACVAVIKTELIHCWATLIYSSPGRSDEI